MEIESQNEEQLLLIDSEQSNGNSFQINFELTLFQYPLDSEVVHEVIKKSRDSKLKLFGRIQHFNSSQYLTKSTPVIRVNELEKEQPQVLGGYLDDSLKECLEKCSQNVLKLKDIIKDHTFESAFFPGQKVKFVYMSMLNENDMDIQHYIALKQNQQFLDSRLEYLQKSFDTDFGLNQFEQFLYKKVKKEKKFKDAYNKDRPIEVERVKKIGISKDRVNNHYTPNQIASAERLIQENQFKNYQMIALKTGIKISSIKKMSSRIQKNLQIRIPRQLKDSIDNFTEEQKRIMLQESLSKKYSLLNIKEKQQRYNIKFQKSIRYSTYRKFFLAQGFSYRCLSYRPIATEAKRNKEQVLRSSTHLIEAFEECDDLIAIDESGLNEKCFQTYFWAPKGIDQKMVRDVRLKNHSLIMAISKRYGVISYQIKKDSLNGGYFMNFLMHARRTRKPLHYHGQLPHTQA